MKVVSLLSHEFWIVNKRSTLFDEVQYIATERKRYSASWSAGANSAEMEHHAWMLSLNR